MRFTVYDHAGKGLYLRQQLLAAGHIEAESVDELDLLLVDCDWHWAYPRTELIQSAAARGAKVVTYPHGGKPTVWVYDGIAEPNPLVDMRLEHGQGSLRLADMFTEDLGQEATGWLFCPTKDFVPVEEPRKILFAPLHANMEACMKGNRSIDIAPALNQGIYKRLLEIPDIELTVSVCGPAWWTGVWAHPKARFTDNPHMLFHHSFEQILSADVVVGSGTMATAAVALGKPVVMYEQASFMDYVNETYVEAKHAEEFEDLCRYPLDATEDDDLAGLIERACAEEQVGWRAEWVGDDGTGAAIGLLEELVGEEEVTGDVVVQGATAQAMIRS